MTAQLTYRKLIAASKAANRLLCGGAILALLLAACSRDAKNGVLLLAPYDADVRLGQVTAVWSNTGEERAFAGGGRLRQPELRFRYRTDVRNRLEDKLFLRLANFRLVDADGLELARATESVECTLGEDGAHGLLAGDVWVSKELANAVDRFQVTAFAVPLSDRERAHYREWLLQGRPAATVAIDAELARYAAAAPCAPE